MKIHKMAKKFIVLFILSTSTFGATATYAAGAALPQSCETVARFLDSCAADLKLLNYEMGGDKLSGPSGGEFRNTMRSVMQKKGVAQADQACTNGDPASFPRTADHAAINAAS